MEVDGSSSSTTSCQGHVYMQCMKNQSANLGAYTVDGCGEFLPSEINSSDLFCSACGCHRSFHRKLLPSSLPPSPPPPPLLYSNAATTTTTTNNIIDRKMSRRARTKFTEAQKASMGSFAERIGWRISNTKREREEEEEVERFLEETGVSRRAFKVWMHNHRNSSNYYGGVDGVGASSQMNEGIVGSVDSSGTETDDSGNAIVEVKCGGGGRDDQFDENDNPNT